MSVTVTCGLNGGEWEFYRDKVLWEYWLDRVMCVNEYEMADVSPHSHKVVIVFSDNLNDIIFKLKAPQYITLRDIPDKA